MIIRFMMGFFLMLWSLAGYCSDPKILLILGDSLSSGYRIDPNSSWPTLLDTRLVQAGLDITVINVSRKGETTEGGIKRLPRLLITYRPTWVVIALGANDGFQGQPLEKIGNNLINLIKQIQENNSIPILVAMHLPPNFDLEYTRKFSATYADVARKSGAVLTPFLLKDVVGHSDLFLWDRKHPNADAQARLLDAIWPTLEATIIQP